MGIEQIFSKIYGQSALVLASPSVFSSAHLFFGWFGIKGNYDDDKDKECERDAEHNLRVQVCLWLALLASVRVRAVLTYLCNALCVLVLITHSHTAPEVFPA